MNVVLKFFLVNICLNQLTLPSSTQLLTQLKQMSPWDQEVTGWYGWAHTEINMLALPISFVQLEKKILLTSWLNFCYAKCTTNADQLQQNVKW
jgi:hypothetical protein